MAVSMRDLDSVFQGAGQKAGIELWRIENFRPVPVPQSSYGKFFTGDSYVILKTTALKSGAFRHDIHYWLGKDTSQDEAGTAAIKTVELDAALGGRAVQYREVQGRETEKFLSYFKPCIIPQEGGVASGFKHFNAEEHQNRLFVCRGKHVVHVKEVPFARSSLNHDDIFILDTKSKIFQFNGSNSSIQERAKALEVVQYIKDTYHDGKCEVAAIEDGKLMADAETGEFWGFFGGFAPLPRKAASENDKNVDSFSTRLLCIEKGQAMPVQAGSLTRELLDTNKCYLLDCGLEVFVWMGRNTSLDDRKSASSSAEELLREADRPRANIIRVIEGFETVMFRSKFDAWPQTTEVTVSEDGRGKVAALLKRQGFNVKGLLKVAPPKEEPQVYIDCTGNLQVWRINGQEKTSIPTSEQSKFYSGDCYIFQYSYPGEDKEEYLVGTWFGKQSGQEERAEAISLASNIIESLKSQPVQCAKQKEIATQPAKEEEERTREQKAKAFAKLEELNRRTFGDNVPSKSDGSKLLPKHDEVPIQEERIVKNAMVSEKLSVGMTQTSNSSIQSRLNIAEEDGGLVNHPAIEFTEVSGFLNHETDAASTSSVSEYNVDDSSSQHKKKHTWNSKSKHKVNDASGESGLLASAPVEGNSIKPSVESGMVKCSETFVQDIRPVLVANTVEPEIVQRQFHL